MCVSLCVFVLLNIEYLTRIAAHQLYTHTLSHSVCTLIASAGSLVLGLS